MWHPPQILTQCNDNSKINTEKYGGNLIIRWDESKFEHYKQIFCKFCNLFAYYLKDELHKIQSCFTPYLIEFVSRGCIIRMRMQHIN